jgi:CheY-like chemotaxis protein
MALESLDSKDPLYHNLQEIFKAAGRSADLTRQLLAFARRQTISPGIIDLNDTISGLLKMLQRLIGEHIDLIWMPGHNLMQVMIDPSQIDQVLANLAVNARDAISDVGRVTIETENTVIDDAYLENHPGFVPGNYVMMAISDSGCGMDSDTFAHIFEPFFTTKKVGEGTGLGLSTVYGIIRQNNGFINVYSEPGKGTTFKIYLPAITSKKGIGSEKISETPLRVGTETILLVEDEETILKLGKKMLERLGYIVLTANNPGEAIRLAEEYPYDINLLITDVIMPEMNGRELAMRIGLIKPNIKRLYMSGYTADVIAHHGVLEKDVQFIQKPFSLKTLYEKVRETLEISK